MSQLAMEKYLHEVEYASTNILEIVWRDHAEVHKLAHEVSELTTATDSGYRRAQAIATSSEDPDEFAMASGAHWETYFGVDKERHHASAALDELQGRLDTRRFSTASAAGAVLQNAKQGISIVHGGRHTCPEGRLVTPSQSLKNVVWQGRNQAIHWEDGSLNQAVLDCFSALGTENHPRFADVYGGSRAFDILHLLGWRTWENFRDDLRTLG